MAPGITKRHRKTCPRTGRCECPWEAWVWSHRDGRKISKRFAREAEARSWRRDAGSALERGTLRAPKPTTVRQAWDAWRAGAEAGTIRNRSGDPYKPSALRSYERHMRLRVLPEFGAVRVADVRRLDLQALADKLHDLSPSAARCTFLPVRAIYRRAMARGEVAVNPCDGLELPAVRGGRDRIADPAEAASLIAAVPEGDRATWATAMYAGLRRGELKALRCQDIDLAAGVIRVERGWDEKEGLIELKSKAGRRRVPIPGILRDYLDAGGIRRAPNSLAFGRTPESPFNAKALQDRADTAWRNAGLRRITLHECRHTFASLMIAAGVNAKTLSTFMGHATIAVTLDRYGHLMPGSEDEAAGMLDAYLDAQRERAEQAARQAGLHDDCTTGASTGARESAGS